MTLGSPLVSPGFAGCQVPADPGHRRAASTAAFRPPKISDRNRNTASDKVFQIINAISASEPRLGGAGMPNRARLIYQCLKLLTFLAVLIALVWSVWRLLT
jgi:hypothetical protein